MDFVLALHSHLPWVLHHGRWPHGSDWLCEAAVDSYLPLLECLDRQAAEGVSTPLTIGVTPVLANQLAHPDFPGELEAFVAQRLDACAEAARDFAQTGETELIPLTRYWALRLERLRRRFRRLPAGIVGAFAGHARAGRIELLSSAATHGFLPLLRRAESVRLQLALGQREHERLFGLEPNGLWLPECAYRAGLERAIAEAGFQFFFVDAHMAEAGRSLGLYVDADQRMPDEAWGMARAREKANSHLSLPQPRSTFSDGHSSRSPYRAYRVGGDQPSVAVFVRDPQTSLRVWSRHQGYPGDGGYLEFHKIRWPGGLKLWRVTGADVDLGGKLVYDHNTARARAHRHAADYAGLLRWLAGSVAPLGGEVIATPFDTELFGHWWFEGLDFLGDVYRQVRDGGGLRPVTASAHLGLTPGARPRRDTGRQAITLAEGSWGANGDFSKWMNPQTAWTWDRLGALEDRFWSLARGAAAPTAPEVWEQATRELLLAQASDWQFIISTGAAGDYAEQRFRGHCDGLEGLLDGLSSGDSARAGALAAELAARDDCFPSVWDLVREIASPA